MSEIEINEVEIGGEIIYQRQTMIPGWEQSKLKNAKVAVIGAGALGNHVCLGLIGLGIGTIKIYDFDLIEAHNLNRQSLFCEEDIGKNKAEALAERLKMRNSSLFIIGINQKIEENSIDLILRDIDLVVDCVDLIYVRRILNRFCLEENIPLVHGGISWSGGQAGLLTRETPCINCIFPEITQRKELEEETSCTRKPEASVVYTSQIISGIMVYLVRRALMPLKNDPPLGSVLFKLDLRISPFFYMEKIKRKNGCECIEILEEVSPEILEKEKEKEKEKFENNEDGNLEELQKLLKIN